MEFTKETPLILGRPFLSTAGAQIDVGAGEIRFNINGKEEKFEFRPRNQETCNMIRIKYEPNSRGIKEVEIHPHFKGNFLKLTEIKEKPEQKKKAAPEQTKVTSTPPKRNKMV